MISRVDDLEYWTDEDRADLAPVLREVMHDDYADADAEAYDEALDTVLESMSMAEAFNFEKALRQISGGAGQVLVPDNDEVGGDEVELGDLQVGVVHGEAPQR